MKVLIDRIKTGREGGIHLSAVKPNGRLAGKFVPEAIWNKASKTSMAEILKDPAKGIKNPHGLDPATIPMEERVKEARAHAEAKKSVIREADVNEEMILDYLYPEQAGEAPRAPTAPGREDTAPKATKA